MEDSQVSGSNAGAAAQQQEVCGQIRDQVPRILASRHFARAGRLRRFLQYVVDQALSGGAAHMKEHTIGVDVFDRKPDYDPRIDPIVRVEARRLRTHLQAYYDSEGRHELALIDLPKGTYTPLFRAREAATPVKATPREVSIAVLPFVNLTPGDTDNYFSDGLTEELIHLLMRVPELCVVSWNSASQLRGREQDLAVIREQLSAGAVLRGSIRRTSSTVRVSVQLIDTASAAYLWSEMYDRSLQDIFSIQEEIAHAIVGTLRLALSAPKGPGTAPARPKLACFNLCLEGRFHSNRRTLEGIAKSAACYEQAIIADASCAQAHAGLANAQVLLAHYGVEPALEAIPKARVAAQQALALDPDESEAHTALAYIRSTFDWQWREAEPLYRRAIASNPSYAQARHWFAVDFLVPLGRFDEALRELEMARRLDPLSQIIVEGTCALQMYRRDYPAALAAYRHLVELDPTFYKGFSGMGRVLNLMGRHEEAVAALTRGLSLAGDVPNLIGAMGHAHATAGQMPEARQCLERLQAIAQVRTVHEVTFSILYLGLGEFERSIDSLERACERREVGLAFTNVHPLYDAVRDHPRFQAVLKRIGFRN
jgi:TolB-like protein